MMDKVCLEAEAAMSHHVMYNELCGLTSTPTSTTTTTAIAAVDASFSQNCAAIICLTTTGRWATNTIRIMTYIIQSLLIANCRFLQQKKFYFVLVDYSSIILFL